MKRYSLMLLTKGDILIASAFDNIDDNKIVHEALDNLVNRFNVRYGKVFENWNTNINIFLDFKETIDKILKNGTIAEITIRIPLLKVFRRQFKRTFNLLSKKDLIVSENDLMTNREKNFEWLSKRLPKQVITQGFLNAKEYEIAHMMNGFRTVEQIAEELGMPAREVQKILYHLNSLGLLKFIDVDVV